VSRSFAFLICLFINFSSSAQTIPELTTADLMKLCPVIKVGGGAWLDIEELDNLRGSAAGASILLLHKLPELLDVKIQYEPPTPFARQLKQLKQLKQLEQGQLDVIAGIYPTKERQRKYLFSYNYYYEKLFIFAKPNKIDRIAHFTDLENFVGGRIRAASYGVEIDELYKRANLSVAVNNQTERLGLLLKDRVDYFIGSISSVGFSPLMKDISISQKPIYHQAVTLGFSPLSKCKSWIPKINGIIETYFMSKTDKN
jgi:ABC-type amino acid transport substrate-binding protein